MLLLYLKAILPLAAVVSAWDAPSYGGFRRVWQDNFSGGAGSPPNGNSWNLITGDIGVNNERQVYTRASRNVQLSGGGTLQITPWRDSSQPKGWTSGRMESKYTLTPQAGKVTRLEASIMFGENSINNKQGYLPAFWALGDSIRHGTGWPACGELDILETVNGILTGHGTVHCDKYPGGICNEGNGIGNGVAIPDQAWHNWRLEIDRTSGDWQQQSINFYMDGHRYHQVNGARIGNVNVWNSLVNSPFYFILNVAVGGNWVFSFFPNELHLQDVLWRDTNTR